ncbi:restriction endonuclease subunit S [Bifidobacterium longum]|nr:restriction endonuclease subunit S [Bifidobacterium longum]
MTEQAKVPAIRFAGFTDPWEQRKLIMVAPLQRGFDLPAEKIIPGVYPVMMSNGIGAYHNEYKVKGPGVVTGRSGTIGNLQYVESAFWPHNTTLWVTKFYGNHPKFIYYLYEKIDLKRYKAGSGVPTLNRNDVHDTMVFFPASRKEQELISAVLTYLDDLITLHQRKYDKLVIFKKSMLEKMFPKDGESVPEIRFAGFTDPWEQRKLGDIAERVTRKNENNESDLPLTISAQHGLIDQRLFFNAQVASRDMSGYYLLRQGEFAYNKSTSADSPWGAIKRLTRYEKGCVSTLYICFALLNANPDYLVTYYETNRWHKAVQMIAAEGARNHGLLNIAPDDFFDTMVSLPESQAEQQTIGAFFSRLDSLITLHQRKLELLQNIKKSLLDKMFV